MNCAGCGKDYLAALAYVLPRLYARRVLLLASGFGLLGLASNVA